METIQLKILNPTGLHARPAREFVDIAKQYKSNLKISHGDKTVNGKSLISLLALGVGHGGEVSLAAEGEDAQSLLAALASAVAGGLGEDLNHLAPPDGDTDKPKAETSSDGGVPASPGLALGPVWQIKTVEINLDEQFSGVNKELARLDKALASAHDELSALVAELELDGKIVQAEIFGAHREILQDPTLLDGARANIAEQQPAGQAWQHAVQITCDTLAQLNDSLLSERAKDIADVGQRVLARLSGSSGASLLPDHPAIIVADDLAPSQTAQFTPDRVLGICTAKGGPTAHTAIIARSLGIPAIVGLGASILEIADGTWLIANGNNGHIVVDPGEEALTAARQQQEQLKQTRAENLRRASEAATTQDGAIIEVVANVGSLADAQQADEFGAEGVGLLRTEFLFLNRETAPDEDEQFAIYQDIANALADRPIIIRTLDIGGDKPLPYIDQPEEENPFLGIRGVRLTLQRPDLFKTQLRAIFRANVKGQFKIMFPMVSDVRELRQARKLVNEVRQELGAAKVDIGIMIEVPSAAICAEQFAPEVDFFSVGTNDLTQYTLAMDRQHPELGAFSDGLHPAVLRLIKMTADAAKAHDKWVGVCGELASDPLATTILLGLGVTELSISPPAVPTIKAKIRESRLADAKLLADQALQCATSREVRALSNTAS